MRLSVDAVPWRHAGMVQNLTVPNKTGYKFKIIFWILLEEDSVQKWYSQKAHVIPRIPMSLLSRVSFKKLVENEFENHVVWDSEVYVEFCVEFVPVLPATFELIRKELFDQKFSFSVYVNFLNETWL